MKQEIKRRIEEINNGVVPQGYKKTKIGIVPDSWNVVKLSSISKHKTQKNISNEFNITFTNSATKGVVKQTDYFDKEISNETNINGYYVVSENDYIYNPRISVSAPCGPINKSHIKETGIVSPLYLVFKLNSDYESNNYYENYFHSDKWYRYMKGVANYGARHDRMNITNDDFFSMPMPVSPVKEQEKIADILTAQDKVISLTEKLVEEKKNKKKYLMQQLLTGKKRLPGFTSEWKKVKLGCCLNEINEKTTTNNEYKILSVTKDGIVLQSEHFNKQIASQNNIGYKILRKGQLAFSIMNLWLGSLDVLENHEIGIISPAYKVFNFNKNIMISCFGKNFLKTHKMLWQYKINSEQGASVVRRNLDLQALFNVKIELPPIEEQKVIAEILSSADREIELLENKLEQEKLKKKSLMQLLLTGIVRVV